MKHRLPPVVLYAEDDPDDRLLAEIAHRDSGASGPLTFVADGAEALEFLRGTGRHAGREGQPRPALLLLDLNMPAMGGLETLAIIRADPVLRRTPVVILTTSAAVEDIDRSYDLGANSYVVKPSAFGSLVQLFDRLYAFWFEVSSLPREVPL
jgi:two-component system response regulator